MKRALHKILHEPTLHFVGLALLLFFVAQVVTSRRNVLEVDRAEVARRITQIELERGGSLNVEQQAQVEEDYIYEQVLAREAQNLVLEGDPRIHDLLVQSMLLHLRSDVVQPPTESELRAYYDANRVRYEPLMVATIDEFLLEPNISGSNQRPVVLRDDVEPNDISPEVLIRHRRLSRLGRADLVRLFDSATAEATFDSRVGAWVGPHRSDRGDHWLRILEKGGGGELPPLETVKEAILQDWMAEQEQSRFESVVAELVERYTVRFVDTESRN